MSYRGRVRNGVVVLEDAAALPEGTEVKVDVVAPHDAVPRPNDIPEDEVIPTLYERLKPLVGMAKGLPADMSVNHDHYLYGLPKRE